MKLTPLTNIVVGVALALGAITSINQPSQARPGRAFYCDTSRNSPVTVYRNHEGVKEPWIRWTSNYFKNAGYDPLTRCQDVSDRLETYHDHKQLRFITTGRMNKQNVICTASRLNGQCERLILTLKPKENPERALNNLFSWNSGGRMSEHGRYKKSYIDLTEHLEARRE